MHPIYRMFFFCDCDFVFFVYTWTDYIMEAKYENNSVSYFLTKTCNMINMIYELMVWVPIFF